MSRSCGVDIDLDALRHNLERVRECAPHSQVMAVVKANAYGHGALPVAQALQGADAIGCARVDEGVQLRDQDARQSIVILEGFSSSEELDEIIGRELTAVIHSRDQLEILAASSPAGPLEAWIKVDTGMNRLGFEERELTDLLHDLDGYPTLRVRGIMSHLHSADLPDCVDTREQIRRFEAATRELPYPRSLANSAGIISWPETRLDWIRPGIMLYGVSPFGDGAGADLGLRPVMSFTSRLIAVRSVREGQSVGYGATYRCERDGWLGVIAAGYGDGYPREIREDTPVVIRGRRYPLVGRVSMDMMTVLIDDPDVLSVGDRVVLWGDELPVEQIARKAGTIPYTLLCGIAHRVDYRYLGDRSTLTAKPEHG